MSSVNEMRLLDIILFDCVKFKPSCLVLTVLSVLLIVLGLSSIAAGDCLVSSSPWISSLDTLPMVDRHIYKSQTVEGSVILLLFVRLFEKDNRSGCYKTSLLLETSL